MAAWLAHRRTILQTLALALVLGGLSGCASTDPRVYHKLEIRLDKSVGRASDLHWSYGPDLPDGHAATASDVSNFENHPAPMRIPENFEISWQTLDGVKHQAKVPVLNHLPESASNRVVGFVVFYDHVEGYLVERSAQGEKATRFN